MLLAGILLVPTSLPSMAAAAASKPAAIVAAPVSKVTAKLSIASRAKTDPTLRFTYTTTQANTLTPILYRWDGPSKNWVKVWGGGNVATNGSATATATIKTNTAGSSSYRLSIQKGTSVKVKSNEVWVPYTGKVVAPKPAAKPAATPVAKLSAQLSIASRAKTDPNLKFTYTTTQANTFTPILYRWNGPSKSWVKVWGGKNVATNDKATGTVTIKTNTAGSSSYRLSMQKGTSVKVKSNEVWASYTGKVATPKPAPKPVAAAPVAKLSAHLSVASRDQKAAAHKFSVKVSQASGLTPVLYRWDKPANTWLKVWTGKKITTNGATVVNGSFTNKTVGTSSYRISLQSSNTIKLKSNEVRTVFAVPTTALSLASRANTTAVHKFTATSTNAKGLTPVLFRLDGTNAVRVATGKTITTDAKTPVTLAINATINGSRGYKVSLMSGPSAKAHSPAIDSTYYSASGTLNMLSREESAYLAQLRLTSKNASTVVLQAYRGGKWEKVWSTTTTNGTAGTANYSTPGANRVRFELLRGSTVVGYSNEIKYNYVEYHAKKAGTAHISKNGGQTYDPRLSFKIDGNAPAGGQVVLQVNRNNTWKTVWTSPKSNAKYATYAANYKIDIEGGLNYRAAILRNGKIVGPSSTLRHSWTRSNTFLSSGTRAPFSGDGLRVASNKQTIWTGRMYASESNRTGSLQELRGNTWVNIANMTFKANDKWGGTNNVTVRTPVTQETTTKKYRIKINQTDFEKQVVSEISTVKHENARHYTGLKKQSYDYMKSYCPNIILDTIPGTTSYAWFPSLRIEMATGLSAFPSETIRFVALHECAHTLEFKAFKMDYDDMSRRLNQIYGSSPNGLEQAADCMARAMGSTTSGVYTNNCSGYRMTAAQLMLQGKIP